MKKLIYAFFSLLILLLCACEAEESPAETEAPEVYEAVIVTPEITPTPEPEHSSLYIQDLPVEDVIIYFNEVCLDSEFINSGDPSFVQKWAAPIYFKLHGSYTEEDYRVLSDYVSFLNGIEGFPGMYETQEQENAAMQIYFSSSEDMGEVMWSIEGTALMDGAVTFWYDAENRIYKADICCRNDIDQHLRNSVILEEIYNGLGPVQDTALRPDSIIYQEYSEAQQLSDIDILLLKLLYNENILCGMNAAECEAVIRQLYY